MRSGVAALVDVLQLAGVAANTMPPRSGYFVVAPV